MIDSGKLQVPCFLQMTRKLGGNCWNICDPCVSVVLSLAFVTNGSIIYWTLSRNISWFISINRTCALRHETVSNYIMRRQCRIGQCHPSAVVPPTLQSLHSSILYVLSLHTLCVCVCLCVCVFFLSLAFVLSFLSLSLSSICCCPAYRWVCLCLCLCLCLCVFLSLCLSLSSIWCCPAVESLHSSMSRHWTPFVTRIPRQHRWSFSPSLLFLCSKLIFGFSVLAVSFCSPAHSN